MGAEGLQGAHQICISNNRRIWLSDKHIESADRICMSEEQTGSHKAIRQNIFLYVRTKPKLNHVRNWTPNRTTSAPSGNSIVGLAPLDLPRKICCAKTNNEEPFALHSRHSFMRPQSNPPNLCVMQNVVALHINETIYCYPSCTKTVNPAKGRNQLTQLGKYT